MRKTPAVQSGRALLLGRCDSPPGTMATCLETAPCALEQSTGEKYTTKVLVCILLRYRGLVGGQRVGPGNVLVFGGWGGGGVECNCSIGGGGGQYRGSTNLCVWGGGTRRMAGGGVFFFEGGGSIIDNLGHRTTSPLP